MKASHRFDSDALRQVLTIAAILAAFGVNVLSNVFPLNGLNIGEISNRFFANVQIIPANYAFAIWGVIYLGLFAFGIYQLSPAQRRNPVFRRVDYLLVLACFAQSIWVYLFLSRLFGLSVIAMLGILLPLIGVYLRLGVGQRRVSRQEQWLAHIPVSIYLGWITVATVVNVALALYASRWTGWGISPQAWTVVMLIVSTAIAALVVTRRGDIAYPAVIIWAIVAIAVRQILNPILVLTAAVLAIILVGLILARQLSVAEYAARERRGRQE